MSENNLKRDYERIWLTDELGEVNWCQDRITADDVEFVRADIYQSANARYSRRCLFCWCRRPRQTRSPLMPDKENFDDLLKRLDKLDRKRLVLDQLKDSRRGDLVSFEQVKTIVSQWIDEQAKKP